MDVLDSLQIKLNNSVSLTEEQKQLLPGIIKGVNMDNKVELIKYESCEARVTLGSNSFAAQDVRSLMEVPVLEILSIQSKESGKGHATKVLNEIVNNNTDKLIILKAEPMFDTEEEWRACKDLDDRIEKLVRFYENRGFTSINDLVCYEYSVAMCYKNELYNEFKKNLNKYRKSNEPKEVLERVY